MTVEYSRVYDPPVPEFSVVQVRLPPGERGAHAAFDRPSVLIVMVGLGRLGAPGEDDIGLEEGSVVFVGAGVDVHFSSWERRSTYAIPRVLPVRVSRREMLSWGYMMYLILCKRILHPSCSEENINAIYLPS